jgi:hypothetical protein
MHPISMLCFLCRRPLLDDQAYRRVHSGELPYRHADPADCPALREPAGQPVLPDRPSDKTA